MLYGHEKRFHVARSILPSTQRRSAAADLARIRRAISTDPKFSWEVCDSKRSNAPRALSPDFPPSGPSYGPWSVVYDRIKDGEWPGRKTDWGTWVARVTGAEVAALVDELYGDGSLGASFPHLQRAFDDLLRWVETVDPARIYALVAMEVG